MCKTFRKQNTDTSVRSKDQIDAACYYLFNSSLFCLGTNDPRSAMIINSLKMPALPLLADNVEQRANLLKQNRNMIKKIVDEIKQAANEEASKSWIESKGYQLEDSDEVDDNAMTLKEFENWCKEDN